MARSAFSLTIMSLALCACAPRIDIGTYILWSARHETGDLSEWTVEGQGGFAANPPTTTIMTSTEVAHGGAYSVKLTNAAAGSSDAARLWREAPYPADAYYSAWYYLPQPYTAPATWTIMQFRRPNSQDPSVVSDLLDLDIRSLPGGELILSVFDHRGPYLRSPTPAAALPLPVGRWLHVEALFRNVSGDDGRFVVWMDGHLNYDIQRPFGVSSTVYWSPCSSSHDLSPADAPIYIDDAAVSLVRLAPDGSL
jgi:hypothetical protein